MLTENNKGTGGIKDVHDPRDYRYGVEIGASSVPFDWSIGYDVEAEIGYKIPIKDQGISSSCGGQAWSYYGQVLTSIFHKVNEEKSAKFIYAQTFVGTGGSDGRTNCNLVINQGWGDELLTPSGPHDELFYERPQDITDVARLEAKKDLGLSYGHVALNIDTIAQAIRDCHGVILGISGQNNGTWASSFPKPPTTLAGSWAHWLYAGKVKTINGKKYIGIVNSWGEDIGDHGWQWLSEDYFNVRPDGYPAIWSLWTIGFKTDSTYIFTKVLKLGMRGVDVKQLQLKLGIPADGIFGNQTLHAVKLFQVDHNLIPDGIVGEKTNAILNSIVK